LFFFICLYIICRLLGAHKELSIFANLINADLDDLQHNSETLMLRMFLNRF